MAERPHPPVPPGPTERPLRLTWRWRVIAGIVIAAVNVVRWRIDVRGLEHVPERGGAVLAFNHHSYVDFIMLAWPIVRRRKRPVRFLAKREIWSSRKVGWVVRWGEAVPVDRGSATARAGAFSAAIEALGHGDLVAVAPEQTISPSFELLPFRTGAARMAQGAGVPIVPVIGWGSHRALTKGAPPRLRLGLPVTVRFGEPLWVGPDDDVVAATAQLQGRMEALLAEEQRRYPGGLPTGAPWLPASLGGGGPPTAEGPAGHKGRARRWDGAGPAPRPDDPVGESSAG
jgi:1-acyl-sn-glycerol-3-phosphate acyltransferase